MNDFFCNQKFFHTFAIQKVRKILYDVKQLFLLAI